MKTTTTAVPFKMVSLKLMPPRTRTGRPMNSKYAPAIEAALKHKRTGAVIDLTDATDTDRARHYSNVLSAIRSRGLVGTLKITRRADALWIHKTSR